MRSLKTILFHRRVAASFNIPWDIVATDSADGKTVYVHVLIPPAAGTSIRLPAPKGGQRFSATSMLLGGKPVKFSQSPDALELSLPADVNWDAADTVIMLQMDVEVKF